MKQLFKELQRCLKEGEPSVLVTIVDSSGSTPEGPVPGCWSPQTAFEEAPSEEAR